MSAIEKALLEATGVKPQKGGEDRQKFLIRIMTAVQKLPDEKWEELGATEGAQDWYNAATEADNAEEPVSDFSDAEEAGTDASEDEPVDEDAVEEEEDNTGGEDEPEEESDVKEPKTVPGKKAGGKSKPAPAKPVKKAAAAKPATAAAKKPVKEAKKAAPKAPKTAKPTSMRRTLKMIVIKKPKMPVEELIEALEKKGFKSPSKLTVTSIRSDTRDTMKVLAEAGLISVEV